MNQNQEIAGSQAQKDSSKKNSERHLTHTAEKTFPGTNSKKKKTPLHLGVQNKKNTKFENTHHYNTHFKKSKILKISHTHPKNVHPVFKNYKKRFSSDFKNHSQAQNHTQKDTISP